MLTFIPILLEHFDEKIKLIAQYSEFEERAGKIAENLN